MDLAAAAAIHAAPTSVAVVLRTLHRRRPLRIDGRLNPRATMLLYFAIANYRAYSIAERKDMP